MDNSQPPLISDPEPGLLDRVWSALRAWRARRMQARAAAPEGHKPQARHKAAPNPADTSPIAKPEYGSKLWERTLAVAFIVPWTVFLIFPVAANHFGRLDASIAWVLERLPQAAPLEIYCRALLWQAPAVALGTFLMRLWSLVIARRNGLNAGATFVLAMLIDGASWFIWGRDHMAAAGLSPALQTAATHFMIVYAVSSLVIWSVMGPPPTKRTGTTGFG